MRFSDDQEAKLNEHIPRSAIRQRAQSGVTLDYVDGAYVIAGLNDVFGPAAWHDEYTTAQVVETSRDDKDRWVIGISMKCQLRIAAGLQPSGLDGFVVKQGEGYGHGIDRSQGKAFESAVKEAETDALKRAARKLGWRLGLALYDKTGAHINESTKTPGTPRQRPKMTDAEKAAAADRRDAARAADLAAQVRAATTVEVLEALKVTILDEASKLGMEPGTHLTRGQVLANQWRDRLAQIVSGGKQQAMPGADPAGV